MESVEMSNMVPKKNGLLVKLKKLWNKELFRSIFFLGITILGVFLFREVLILILKTEYPLTTPISASMEPTLMYGDLLVVQGGLNGEDIEVGDIIVFRKPSRPEEFLVHRVFEKIEHEGTLYFITKGDNNPDHDRWICEDCYKWGFPESYIIGKVIWRIPLLGYIKIYLGTPIAMVISISLLVALLLLDSINLSKKSGDSEKREASEGSESPQKMSR